MRKKLLITAIVLGAVALGVILWVALTPDGVPSSGLDRAVVRLKWLHQAQFAGFYVADKKGLYEKNGIRVTLNPGGVDFPAVQMVASGSEDFGVTGGDQILIAREKEVPIVAIAVIYRKSPFVLFSLAGSGITTPQDFVGRRVGVKLGGNEELTYRAMMRKLGIDMASVTEVPVKYDMSPLFSGLVEVWPGYAINEPIVAMEKGHNVNIISPSAHGVNLYADTLFTTEKMISDKPDLVRRFVEATLQGWAYATENPEEASAYALEYSDRLTKAHELAMMKTSIDLLKPDDKPIGTMEEAAWRAMERLLIENKFLKAPVALDKAYTTRFLGD